MKILRVSIVILETGIELVHARYRAEQLLVPLLESPCHGQVSYNRSATTDIRRGISFMLRISQGRFSCLYRSIAAARVLRRRGISAVVRIAPHSVTEGRFTAHAWVELSDNTNIGRNLTTQPTFTRAMRKSAEERPCEY